MTPFMTLPAAHVAWTMIPVNSRHVEQNGTEAGGREALVGTGGSTAGSGCIGCNGDGMTTSDVSGYSSVETTDLLTLVDDGFWEEAARRALSHPKEARRKKYEDNSTVLHQACMNDAPIIAVDAILRAYPEATLVQDNDGWTPLHTACYFDASVEVVHRLLQANSSAITKKDAEGRTPLLLLHTVTSSRWRENRVEEIVQMGCGSGNSDEPSGDCQTKRCSALLRGDTDLCRIWNKARHLIRAAYRGGSYNEDGGIEQQHVEVEKGEAENEENRKRTRREQFRLVHACSGIPECPADFVKLAVGLHPEQLSEADEAGNLPLHIAASSEPSPAGVTEVNQLKAGNEDEDCIEEGNKPLSKFNMVEFLLNAYPAAGCKRNHQGFLPFHLAVVRGKRSWEQGVGALLRAYPAAIIEGDAETGLYPFMNAAVASSQSTSACASLGTIYQLFKSCPELERFSRWPRRRDVNNRSSRSFLGKKRDLKTFSEGKFPCGGKDRSDTLAQISWVGEKKRKLICNMDL